MINIKVYKPSTYILLSSIFIFILMVILFFVGLLLNKVIFFGVLGKPEEMGWLLFMLTGGVFGLSFSFVGSLLGAIIVYLHARKNADISKNVIHPFISLVLPSYFLGVLWMLVAIILIGKIIPPCPTCVR